MNEFLQFCFSWPTVVPSVLMCVVLVYWLLTILGAVDFGLFDIDLDIDTDVDTDVGIFDWGMAGLRWFNLGDVPLMIWLSAFAFPAWIAALILHRDLVDPTPLDVARALAWDFLIGMFAAKILTHPLKGKLKHVEPNPADELIGSMVTITSSEVTTAFGQAQFHTGQGAPLNLNVRTLEGVVNEGTGGANRRLLTRYAPVFCRTCGQRYLTARRNDACGLPIND